MGYYSRHWCYTVLWVIITIAQCYFHPFSRHWCYTVLDLFFLITLCYGPQLIFFLVAQQ